VLALYPFSTSAGTTYTYTGGVFTQSYEDSPGRWPTSGRITAKVTFDAELAPNHRWEETATPGVWSISDGVHTIDQTISALSRIHVSTDEDGNILHWQIEAFVRNTQGIVGLVTFYDGKTITELSLLFGSDGALKAISYNDSAVGTWKKATSTPAGFPNPFNRPAYSHRISAIPSSSCQTDRRRIIVFPSRLPPIN